MNNVHLRRLFFGLLIILPPQVYASEHMCFSHVEIYGDKGIQMLELTLANKISIGGGESAGQLHEKFDLDFKLRKRCDNSNLKLALKSLERDGVLTRQQIKESGKNVSVQLSFARPYFTKAYRSRVQNILTLALIEPVEEGQKVDYGSQVRYQLAQRALVSQRYEEAVFLFESLLGSEQENGAEILEKLALARERNGQAAQAAALYNQFLVSYPKSKAVIRVKQRLSQLFVDQLEVKSPIVKTSTVKPIRKDQKRFYGAFNQIMLLSDQRSDSTPGVEQATVISGINLGSRIADKRKLWRFNLVADHRYDMIDRDAEKVEINNLLVEYKNSTLGLKYGMGRNRGQYGGIFGKFDGAYLEFAYSPRWAMAFSGGFPVRFDSKDRIQTEKYFNTAALIYRRGGWQVQPYGAYQRYNNVTGRAALGEEIAYSDDKGYFRQSLDYDIYFDKLNLISIQGNYRFIDSLSTYITLELRRSPMLEIENAMIGEFRVDEFSTLQEIVAMKEIKERAELFSSLSRYANLGAEYAFANQLSIKLDSFLSSFSYNYQDFDGIVSEEDTQIDVSAQITKRQLWAALNDGIDFSIRYTLAENYENYRGTLRYRFRPLVGLVVDNYLSTSRRINRNGEEVYIVRPVLKLNYQWQKSVWNQLEVGHEWWQYSENPQNNYQRFLFNLVYRYMF